MKTTTRTRNAAAILITVALAAIAGCAGNADDGRLRMGEELVSRGSDADIAEGLRALAIESARRAGEDLARPSGYERRDATRLPMPEVLSPTVGLMRAYGYGTLADPVLVDINRGLQLAAQKIQPVVQTLVGQATLADPVEVMRSNRGATDILCGEAGRVEFEREYATVLAAALAEVGYYNSLKIYVDRYNSIPILADIPPPDPEPELRERGLNGFCLRMAAEEARLRDDPEERKTEIIQRLLARPI